MTRTKLPAGTPRAVLTCVAATVLLAGCATSPTGMPAGAPPPELELIGAGELAIPRDCTAPAGQVYRTTFVVQPDGRVTGAATEAGSACLQLALRQWVSTFRYRPVSQATPAAIDWMGVTAARGG
jgi:hypothetical protein